MDALITIKAVLNLLSGASALLAAFFWWRSAAVPFPEEIIFDGNGYGDGPNQTREFTLETMAKKIARESKRGAILAGISAVLMALATFIDVFWE